MFFNTFLQLLADSWIGRGQYFQGFLVQRGNTHLAIVNLDQEGAQLLMGEDSIKILSLYQVVINEYRQSFQLGCFTSGLRQIARQLWRCGIIPSSIRHIGTNDSGVGNGLHRLHGLLCFLCISRRLWCRKFRLSDNQLAWLIGKF